MYRIMTCRPNIVFSAALLVLICLQSPAIAGGLTGRVVDKNGGSALAGATIRLEPVDHHGKTYGVAADRDGYFEIADILGGTYSATVSAIGFTPEYIPRIAIPDSGVQTLNISLTPASINLHGVSVTASRRPEKILDAPASVSVVGSEDIEARTALTPTEYFKGLPGVDVATG